MPAAVGFHCPQCVTAAQKRRPVRRTQFGAKATKGQPVVTFTVIGLCVVMYLLQLTTASPALARATGLQLPNITELMAYAPLHTSDEIFQPWRMLTSSVLHSPSSAMHILFNMVALWFVGRVIEPAIGHFRFALLLVLSALGGSVAVLFLTDPLVMTVGASGAVFGLFGALFVLLRATGSQVGGIVALVAINMGISFMVPGISWQGHLGGLITGLLVALVIAKAPRNRRNLWQGLGLSTIALLLILLTAVGAPLVIPRLY